MALLRPRLHYVLWLALCFTWMGCDESKPSAEPLPKAEAGVRAFSLNATPRQGHAPLSVTITFRFETNDPRATVSADFDFGDGQQGSRLTQTLLPAEPDPDNLEAELIPEQRTATITHLYTTPGRYTIRAKAVDISNSNSDPAQGDVIEIASTEQVIDIEALALPDLIAVQASVSRTEIGHDETFPITFQILNNGTSVTRPFDVDVYLVSRLDLQASQLVDSAVARKVTMYRVADGLSAGDSHQGSVTVAVCDPRAEVDECDKTLALMQGKTWYPAIYVDPPNEARPDLNVVEQSKSNNFRVGTTGFTLAQVSELPDLKPLSVLANPRNTNILKEVYVGFEVHNTGESDAGASTYAVYLSRNDKILDPEDIEVGRGTILPISAGGRQILANLKFRLPQDIYIPGQYWILVKTDLFNDVEESNELNNVAASAEAITVEGQPPSQIDIAVQDLTASPLVSFLGGRLDISFEVANLGTDNTGTFFCGVYLAPAQTLDMAQATFLAQVGTDNLPGGLRLPFERQLLVPNSLTPGTYYVFVFCDHRNQISEITKDNNIAGPSPAITINALPQVDYVVQDLLVKPTAATEDGALFFLGNVCNQGSDAAGPVAIRGVINPGNAIGATGDIIVATGATTQMVLQPGACEPFEISGKINCLPFVDTYTAGVIVDPTNQVAETNETNNIATFTTPVVVSGGTLCACIEDSYEGSGNNSESEATLLTLQNNLIVINDLGLCDARDFYAFDAGQGDTVQVTLTFDRTLGELDLRLYNATNPASPFTAPGSTGTKTLSHVVTATGTTRLYVEVLPRIAGVKNYYQLRVQITPAPREPDLIVDSVTLQGGTYPPYHLPFVFEAVVRNNGLDPAFNFEVGAWFSRNTTLDAQDLPIPPLFVNELAPYATTTLRFEVPFPDEIVAGTQYVIVKADSGEVVTETNENNNTRVSSSFIVDTACVVDYLEGDPDNDVFDRATRVDVAPALQRWDDLNVCTAGRDDFYLVCAPAHEVFNHAAVYQIDQSSSSTLEVALYRRDRSAIGSAFSTTDAIISVAVPPNTCTGDADCFGGETCIDNRCQDTQGDRCLYMQVKIRSAVSSVTSRDYSLVFDRVEPNQLGEPMNDVQNTAVPFSMALNTLAAGAVHAHAGVDQDWYTVELKAGTAFTARLHGGDSRLRLDVVNIGTTATVLPGKERAFTVPTTPASRQVWFKVYKSSGTEPTSAYRLELEGLEGIDLVVKDFQTDLGIVARNDAVLASWTLANDRMLSAGPVHYSYVLSKFETPHASDVPVATYIETSLPGFTSTSISQKVYLDVPRSVFGDFNFMVHVDPDDLYSEINETNNTAFQPLTLLHDCLPDDLEPNNSIGTATLLTLPGQDHVDDALTLCPSDVDFYAIGVAPGHTITVRIDQMEVYTFGDLDLFLYDDSANLLARSDQIHTPWEEVTYVYNGTEETFFYVRVVGFRPESSNVYRLQVVSQAP